MASFSFYHEIHSQYKRYHDDTLIEALDNASLYTALSSCVGTRVTELFTDRHALTYEYYTFDNRKDIAIHRYELLFPTHVSGLIFVTNRIIEKDVPPMQRGLNSRTYFALILLMQPSSRAVLKAPFTSHDNMTVTIATTKTFVEKVCAVFEEHLLFQGPENDRWHAGKAIFRDKVHYYVEKRSMIRFCLPAFPCKSSNPDKVASLWPDGAEYEALTNLFNFCLAIKAVYPPGALLEIVSDGHVFSDCVGVDDETVSEYTHRLRRIAVQIRNDIAKTAGNENCGEMITFQGLAEILYPDPWVRNCMKHEFTDLDHMFHPVNTRRTL